MHVPEKYPRIAGGMDEFKFSGRYVALNWGGDNMKLINFEPANQFIRREYRKGWVDFHSDYSII